MGRAIHRLAPTKVKTAKPGMHCDGGGLYLQCTLGAGDRVSRSWIFRYADDDGERKMGLGSADDVGLAEARAKAATCRQLRAQGVDPIQHRDAELVKRKLEAARAITFDAARDAYIKAHGAGWRNLKHSQQWKSTLTAYATPVFGALPVASVDTALIVKALEPIWTTKPETAGRVRGRIESILDWAKVSGFREGENPARWRGHLDMLLAKRSRVRSVEHHAALRYADIHAFMADLTERPATAARALEFTILTAARTGEAIGARWDEINLREKLWTVPAERMKAGKEHRVPLSDRAIAVLKRLERVSDFIFPADHGGMLSNMAMAMLLRRMGHERITVHGFRSTFRDWAAERSTFPADVAEAALAHAVPDKVVAAYKRGDFFDKRRRLMDAWAGYCNRPLTTALASNVTAIRQTA